MLAFSVWALVMAGDGLAKIPVPDVILYGARLNRAEGDAEGGRGRAGLLHDGRHHGSRAILHIAGADG